MGKRLGRTSGCGCGIVLAIILVIALVGWLLSFQSSPLTRPTLQPIPADIPPQAGAEVPAIDVNAPGRTSDQLSAWAQPLSQQTNVSAAALRAYGNAELIAAQTWPQCNLRWNTLAGIGWVETRHGTYSGKFFGGASLNDQGLADPPIIGIPLDGSPGVAEIPDTDGGEWDNDPEYDRAIGPMQFIPDSWRRYGLDADGDSYPNPHQIDDAALGAAHHLCDGGRDLATPEGWSEAVLSYNRSQEYVVDVRDAAASYALNQPAF